MAKCPALTSVSSATASRRWVSQQAKTLGTGNPISWELSSNTWRLHSQYIHPHIAAQYASLEMFTATNETFFCTSAVFVLPSCEFNGFSDVTRRLLACVASLGRHGSASLRRDGQENKMAAAYNVLAFKR